MNERFYFSDDWLLRFLYRTASVQLTIAGLQPIAWQDRRMVNVDLTNIVSLCACHGNACCGWILSLFV